MSEAESTPTKATKYRVEALQARHRAVSRLIDKYPDEFQVMINEEREKAGLPPQGVTSLQQAEHRIARLEALLRDQGIEV